MADWVMFGRDGTRLGLAADWGDFDPDAVVALREASDAVSELWLYRRWAPASLLNMDGMGHANWICLTGTIQLGTFGGGRMYCCLLYTSPSPRDRTRSRMPSSA